MVTVKGKDMGEEPSTLSDVKSKSQRNSIQTLLERCSELKQQQESVKRELGILIPDLASALAANGISKIAHEGWMHSVFNGTNVSISADRLRQVLLKHKVGANEVAGIVDEATTRTAYTTVSSKRLED